MFSEMSRTQGWFMLAASTLIVAVACGFTTGRTHTGTVIEQRRAVQIVPGTTTKGDLLDWFGPPLAVFRRGSLVTVPQGDARPVGWREVQADTFFELFSNRTSPEPDDVIYYYAATELVVSGMYVVLAGGNTSDQHETRLWVLIEGATGGVKDFIYRRDGKNVAPPSSDLQLASPRRPR